MKNLPALPVYDAYKIDKGTSLTALIVAVAVTLIIAVSSVWGLGTHPAAPGEGTAGVMYVLGMGFCILLSLGLLRAYWRKRAAIQEEKQGFQHKAVSTTAHIVGREREDGGEYADSFYIYYQFHPDFIIKAPVKGKLLHYYELPEGSVIEIEYCMDKHTQSRLK
ncbi:MAG: hypothetical protein SF053_05220 [Bacteroidia bacterium]|nr:hypothetical protein [Bacteroidia bacterium]